MARLLLWPGVMTRAALALVVLAGGCLYTGGLNQAPTVELDADATSTFKGSPITLYAHVHDDDEAPPAVEFSVTDASGAPVQDPCAVDISSAANPTTATFLRTGTFRIEALARDHYGATGSASVLVTITDAPPIFGPAAKPVPTSPRDMCDLYVAGAPVTLALDGSVSDADADVTIGSCHSGETLRYTYRITAMPDGARPVLTPFDGGGCAAPGADSGVTLDVDAPDAQVCLWPDVGAATASAMYSVVLDVGDGTTTITSAALDVPVAADEPPCLTGTLPPTGSYVLDRSAPQRFEVDGLKDDLDTLGSAHYVWSLWRDSDPVWRVVPEYDLSYYDLDTASFGVGEHVALRVEARDRTDTPAPCADSVDDCIVSSCAVGTGQQCHQWKTWDLELR